MSQHQILSEPPGTPASFPAEQAMAFSKTGLTEGTKTVGTLAGLCFALRVAGVLSCVRLFSLEPSTGAIATLCLVPALLVFLCFHSLGSISPQHRRLPSLGPVLRWLMAYILFAGVSLLWTDSVAPLASFAYWLGLVIDLCLMLLLVRLHPVSQVAEGVFRGYMLGACAIAVLAWLMPEQSDLRLGDPEFLNTNQIANTCALGVFFAQLLTRTTRVQTIPAAALLCLTLLRSLSKATLIAFLLSQGFLLWRDPAISRRTKWNVLLSSLMLILLFSGLLLAYYDVYTTAGNQAETFTGRTAIWAWSGTKVLEAPWMGHGFDSMWKIIPPLGPDRFEARHAENEILQQVYSYGAVGLFLVAGLYFSLFRAIQRSSQYAGRWVLSALLIYIWARGLVEAEPFDLLLPVWSILILAALLQTRTSFAEPQVQLAVKLPEAPSGCVR